MATKKNTPTSTVAPKATDIAALSVAVMAQCSAKPALNTAPAQKTASTHSTWSGVLAFGMVSIGVKLYKATEVEKVELNTVHACSHNEKDGNTHFTQLKQRMFCPECTQEVEHKDRLSGYQFGEGKFAVLTAQDKKSCQTDSDKKMNITEFVNASEVDPLYFESAAYLAPDKGFDRPFTMLREAMVSRGVVAIAQTNASGREYTLILRPYGTNGITAHYMYFDNEIRSFDKWNTAVVSDTEVELAGMLIDAMTDTFDPTEYSDGYLRRFKGLINDRVSGVSAPAVQYAEPKIDAKADILAAIKASLAQPVVKKTKKAKA